MNIIIKPKGASGGSLTESGAAKSPIVLDAVLLERQVLEKLRRKKRRGGEMSQWELEALAKSARRLQREESHRIFGGARTNRDNAARLSKTKSQTERDIGEILPPDAAAEARRKACEFNFQLFCEQFMPMTFHMAWSADHLTVIQKIQYACLHGGTYAIAMPRGHGKTALVEAAALWAALYGHRTFIVLIGSDEAHALMLMDSIKTELETNDEMLESFPEICRPCRALEGIPNRCAGQLCEGERTNITLGGHTIIFPTVKRADGFISKACGVIIRVSGLTGGLRGMKYKRKNGQDVRPDFVIPDDPQTDESARSASQCEYRESLLSGAVLGLAGPKRKIAGVMPCTVIVEGDLADRMLDRTKNPYWQGDRIPMVSAFPTNQKLWSEYADLRADSFRRGAHGEVATEFYKLHRAEMDVGAVVSWSERFNDDEVSGVQHAMNLLLRDEKSFWAEYQNQPKREADTAGRVRREWITDRHNGAERGIAPKNVEFITAFFDVQAPLIFWMVCGWTRDFTGSILDYGTFPRQGRTYYTLKDARPDLVREFPLIGSLEGRIFAGLKAAVNEVFGREFKREDGIILRVQHGMIDSSWGDSTDTVYQYIRSSAHAAHLFPSFGRYVGAASPPMESYKAQPGERVGDGWRMPIPKRARTLRHVIYDVNKWKSFVRTRLATPLGEVGSLIAFEDKRGGHKMLADHFYSEVPTLTEGRGRQVEEWRLTPDRPDNHFWDCLVGCTVGASMLGCALRISSLKSEQRKQEKKMKIRRRAASLKM